MGWLLGPLEKSRTCQKQCPVSQLIRMLTLVDDCTRERPAIEVDIRKANGERRGLSEEIVGDNGPEFRGRCWL